MEGSSSNPQGQPHPQQPSSPGYSAQGGPDTTQYPAPAPPPGGYQQPPPQGYAQPPYQGQQGHQGPGVGERANQAMHSFQRQIRTPETKPFFRSSEFAVWLVTVVGILIAGAAVDNGAQGDPLRADTVWLLVAVTSFAYIISRGISKAGTRYREESPRLDEGPRGR